MVVEALGATRRGRISVRDGRAQQSNFADYPILRINEVPTVNIKIVDIGSPLGGVGEPGVPPLAPALGGALLAASGRPVRTLPLVEAGWTFASPRSAGGRGRAEPTPGPKRRRRVAPEAETYATGMACVGRSFAWIRLKARSRMESRTPPPAPLGTGGGGYYDKRSGLRHDHRIDDVDDAVVGLDIGGGQ